MSELPECLFALFILIFLANAVYVIFFRVLIVKVRSRSPKLLECLGTDFGVSFGASFRLISVLYRSRMTRLAKDGGFFPTLVVVRVLLPACFLMSMWILVALAVHYK